VKIWLKNGGGESLTIESLARVSDVHIGAWTHFMKCGIGRACSWELMDLPVDVRVDTEAAKHPVPGQAAFLFEKWASLPPVRESLRSLGLVVDPSERSEREAADAAGVATEAATNVAADDTPSGGVNAARGNGAEGQEAGVEADRILRTKFGLDDEAVKNAKTVPDGYFKWSVISKIARVGNPNFKKFRATKKFAERVPPAMADTCKRDGVAHTLSPHVAVHVLSMCDKV
jgi:hypothetical protein